MCPNDHDENAITLFSLLSMKISVSQVQLYGTRIPEIGTRVRCKHRELWIGRTGGPVVHLCDFKNDEQKHYATDKAQEARAEWVYKSRYKASQILDTFNISSINTARHSRVKIRERDTSKDVCALVESAVR